MDLEVLEFRPVLAANFENILEPLRGDQTGSGKLPGQEGIGGERRSVNNNPYRFRVNMLVTQEDLYGFKGSQGRVRVRGGNLDSPGPLPVIPGHQVGEGPSDVHSNPYPSNPRTPIPSRLQSSRTCHTAEPRYAQAEESTPRGKSTDWMIMLDSENHYFHSPYRSEQNFVPDGPICVGRLSALYLAFMSRKRPRRCKGSRLSRLE